MAGTVKRIDQFDPLVNGSSGETNLKLSDKIPAQHVDIPSGKNKTNNLNVGQLMCQPVASCAAQQSGGIYSATCINFPDFSLTYTDKDNNPITLVGMKVRVVFTYACNYGSTSDGTYPQLRINNSSAKPMLAQGKPMATGAWSAGQCLEFTLIPYGSDYAWDCDSNVREVTSSYTVYADGTTVYSSDRVLPYTYLTSTTSLRTQIQNYYSQTTSNAQCVKVQSNGAFAYYFIFKTSNDYGVILEFDYTSTKINFCRIYSGFFYWS